MTVPLREVESGEKRQRKNICERRFRSGERRSRGEEKEGTAKGQIGLDACMHSTTAGGMVYIQVGVDIDL